MRHGVADKKFNRHSNHRKALFKNLVMQLVRHGEILTTVPKAKAIKRIADKLFSRATDSSLATRRDLHKFFGRRDVVNTMVDTLVPAMGGRTSGFTRIVKVGVRRGDNTHMAKLALVDASAALNSWQKPASEDQKAAVTAEEKPAKKATDKAPSKSVEAKTPKKAVKKPAKKSESKKDTE